MTNILNKNEVFSNPPKKRRKKRNKNININLNNKENKIINVINLEKNKNINKLFQPLNKEKEEIINKSKKIMEYNDEELNDLSFELALKYDKRNYCEYYISLLKINHIIIFTFIYNKDYNSRIIKIDLFFISFTIFFTINALFFNDDTMHKIYEDQGSFNIIYQIPQIAYSSLISVVLDILLKLLALTEGNILDYKKNKEKMDLDKRTKDLNNKLNIKFIFYFISSTLFLLFLWYYLSMFCAIYRITQYHLIKDTLISFGASLIYPFGIYLLPGIFRIPALSNPKNKRKCLYILSKLFQML